MHGIKFRVAVAAHVFAPRHFAGILAKMRPGDMVMLTNLRASQPGDIAFGLVRAGAIFAVGFPMIDPLHFKARMKIVPSSRLGSCRDSGSRKPARIIDAPESHPSPSSSDSHGFQRSRGICQATSMLRDVASSGDIFCQAAVSANSVRKSWLFSA